MTTRSKEFNDWMTAQYPRYKPSDDSVNVRVAWSVWQAATKMARKHHAALCDRFYARGMNAAECADAIRGTT